ALFAMKFGGGRGWSKGWDFGGGDWGDGGGRGRGRRGRGRMFDGGELRLLLLRLIADEPRHGYDLIRAIEELSHGAYAPSPGVVYPTLTMLQDMDLIEETKSEGARKAFRVTEEGEAHLTEHAEEVDGLLERLKEAGSDNRKAGGAPIKRSVASLLSALWHRVTREDADDEVMHKIAAILDDAAQKIERLT
ncbi:MAG: PadR family transcriptional regulator, partial [Sphingomonas sp.]